MRPSYESVLQRMTYKNLRSIQRRSSKSKARSPEAELLRMEDVGSYDEQPMRAHRS
jgi:hypothetical protein